VTVAPVVALAFAVVGAVGYGAGSVTQALAARRSTGTLHTLRQPLYLVGLGCDLLAWLASIVALRTLAVYQVQAVLAGSLAVTVLGARVVLAARLRRRDGVAVAVTVLALVVLALSAGPQDQLQPSGAVRFGLVSAAVLVAVGGWVAARAGSPGASAALAGLAFGGAALCARALPSAPTARGVPAVLGALAAEPLTWGLVGFGVTGMLLYTHALQEGQVGPVTAVLWIVEVIAPSVVGVAILHDAVRDAWAPYAVAAVLATTAAAAVLATAPATAAATPP
jgi:drug/metabolite transporter (DMT)-like permease